MRALLNAMGVTLWGAIAITLAVAVGLVGYRAALYHRSEVANDAHRAVPILADITPTAQPVADPPPAAPSPRQAARLVDNSARTLLHQAAAEQRYERIEQYGEQLFAGGGATAEDMAIVGHFVYLRHDCPNAVLWSDRSIDASRSRGEQPRDDVLEIKRQCGLGLGNSAPRAAAVSEATRAPTESVAKDPRELSRVIAKEMTAAQKAIRAQQWQEAIKNLEVAETKSPLTAFDQKTIHYLLGYVNIKINNLKVAQDEYEKTLATGAATAEESGQMSKALFAIAASTGQYQKTIDYGKQMVDAGTATPENLLMISQSYFQLKDCRDAIVWADNGIASARKAGESPKENFYLFKLQCASDSQDNAAMDPVLVDLIKINNKTSYWNTLLRIERQDERDDHNTLMIYRIMYNTNAMKEDTDYIEMAQLLGDAALPGEAASVLTKAMSAGAIRDEHKERTNRLLTALQGRAESDNKGLVREEAEASESDAGEISVKLGEILYGIGDYQEAADAITRGLQKGRVRHLDEADVYLGLSEAKMGNIDAARKAFANLRAVPNVSPRLIRLWDLYAGSITS